MYKTKGRACLPLFLLSFKHLYSPRLYNNTTDKLCCFDTFLIAGQQNAFAIPQNLCRILRYFAMKSDEKFAQRANFSHLINSNYLKIPLPKSAFADIISEYLVLFLYCRSFAETFSTFENYKQDLKHPPICDNRITTAW